MLRFTKRADYGLMAIHYIAIHDDLGAVSVKRIVEEFGIPQELLAKILQRLAKQGLIVSQNGPKGGYVLSRRATEISIGEVVRALDAETGSPSIASSPAAAATRSFRTSRRRALLALTTLIVLAATAAGYGISRRTAPRAGDATRDTDPATGARALGTLAVLPFVNTSGTTADDYFSDGMTDELAHALASIPGLHIAGRTSSYTFKGKSATAQEIGRVLDVGAIIAGTVRPRTAFRDYAAFGTLAGR